MKREEAKTNLTTILGSEPTDEQVTAYLDSFHTVTKGLNDSLQTANDTINSLNDKVATLSQVETEYNALKQSQMTEQEKLELKQKEIETNLKASQEKLKEANITNNIAKAKAILSEIGEVDESLLKTLVTPDENQTIQNATALATLIKNDRAETATKTKQDLASIDVTPTASNVQNDVMTWDKFSQMSQEEQTRFANEHPDEFNNL